LFIFFIDSPTLNWLFMLKYITDTRRELLILNENINSSKRICLLQHLRYSVFNALNWIHILLLKVFIYLIWLIEPVVWFMNILIYIVNCKFNIIWVFWFNSIYDKINSRIILWFIDFEFSLSIIAENSPFILHNSDSLIFLQFGFNRFPIYNFYISHLTWNRK